MKSPISRQTMTRLARLGILPVLAGLLLTVAAAIGVETLAPAPPLPRLRVSASHRFLVKEDGSPFFYPGDTAWELFDRLDPRPGVATQAGEFTDKSPRQFQPASGGRGNDWVLMLDDAGKDYRLPGAAKRR